MGNSTNTIKTLKISVKGKHKTIIGRMAFDSNQVCNAANAETSEWCYILRPEVGYIRNSISAFDLQKQRKTIKKKSGFIIPAVTVPRGYRRSCKI